MKNDDQNAGVETDSGPQARTLNRQMLRKLVIVAVMMFGFGYGLIPVYRQICELTGINVLSTQEAAATRFAAATNSQLDKSRTITVEFDANSKGPWRFRPTVSSVQVHPGEMTQVVYEVVNTQSHSVNAQAIPSYAPQEAGAHFKKVECFCFTQQTLKANEARQMPVVFYVDRDLPKDVKTITLSYTFFEIGGALKQATQPEAPVPAV